jgi:malate dehydrogenase
VRDIAILGAGELGGALAYLLARREIASVIRLVDDRGDVAAGKALDITQAGPIERFNTTVLGGHDIAAAAHAAILVIADRGDGTEDGDRDLLLLRQLAALAPGRPIVCAGPQHRELVGRGARELGLPRRVLIGSAPEALAGALRALVALEADRSPQSVALTVLGVPPSQVVVPWEEASIGGLAATRVLDTPALRRLATRIAPLWPPGAHALACAAARIVELALGDSRQTASCFVAPDDSSGRRTRAVALPARLGRGGIVRADVPELSVRDRVALESAMLL